MDSLSSVLEHRSASNIVVPSLPHARKLWEGGKVFLSFVFEQLGVRIKISLEKKTLNIGHKKITITLSLTTVALTVVHAEKHEKKSARTITMETI